VSFGLKVLIPHGYIGKVPTAQIKTITHTKSKTQPKKAAVDKYFSILNNNNKMKQTK